MMRRLVTLGVLSCVLLARPLSGQCGGVDRWAVKMAADPAAFQIDMQTPIPTSLHDLVRLNRPSLPSDEVTRTTMERGVRVVEGRLIKFKEERGKTGDSDYHLVISDSTLLFSPGGPGTQASPHSFVAEIANPECVTGRHGNSPTPSSVATRLVAVRQQFQQRFTHIVSGWNDGESSRVRLTGLVFFDPDHGQVGRALNGVELHPLIDVEFLSGPGVVAGLAAPAAALLTNPGFESGQEGWTATADVIGTAPDQPAHTGQGKAWLGGFGEVHLDRLSQRVTLPAQAEAISLSFFLHIDTEESNPGEFDKLTVRIKSANGQVLKTLRTFTNQNAAPGFQVHSFDLTSLKGRTIRIEFEAREDNGSVTSFVVDDVAVVVESP